MPRPAKNDDVNRAVEMVANGAVPRAAWEACGKPNGPSAISNIRVRGRTLKRSREAALAGATTGNCGNAAAAAVAAPMTAEEAVRWAEAEGLTLVKREG